MDYSESLWSKVLIVSSIAIPLFGVLMNIGLLPITDRIPVNLSSDAARPTPCNFFFIEKNSSV